MNQVIIFVGACFVVLMAMSLVVRPSRLKLRQLVDEKLAKPLSPDEIAIITRIAGSAYSVRTAPLIFLSFVVGILRRHEQLDEDADKFQSQFSNEMLDSDMRQILDLHMASAAAVNPIFGSLAYAAKWAFVLKARAHFSKLRNSKQQPDMKRMLEMYELKASL